MNVLSLFDGMSCGQIALERAGIKVDKYFASEIDPSAIRVTMENYPKTIQLGDVRSVRYVDGILYWSGGSFVVKIDLLIGGSPCQDLCMMGGKQGLNGEKSALLFEFIRIKKETQAKFFLLENNASMTKENRSAISVLCECEPIMINSADFSAQNRKRLYWSNICVGAHRCVATTISDIWEARKPHKDLTNTVLKYLSGEYSGRKIERTVRNALKMPHEKTNAIGTRALHVGSNTFVAFNVGGRYYQPTQTEFERLQTLPDGYTSCVSVSKAVYAIGNGWTVDVITHIFSFLPEEYKSCTNASPKTCIKCQ